MQYGCDEQHGHIHSLGCFYVSLWKAPHFSSIAFNWDLGALGQHDCDYGGVYECLTLWSFDSWSKHLLITPNINCVLNTS